jgi:hypothetical protein
MYRLLPLLILSTLGGCGGGDASLPAASGTLTLHNGEVLCSCRETGHACSFWPDQRPPPQPDGAVMVLRRSNGQLLGFACEHGGMVFDTPKGSVRPSARIL